MVKNLYNPVSSVGKDNMESLLKLIRENPGLEIIPLVDNESVCGGYGRSVAEIGSSYISEYCFYTVGGEVKFYDDREEFVDDWIEQNYDWLCKTYGNNESIFEREANMEADNLFVKKAIILNIDRRKEY